jgi:glycosyltransferase involved in cell wall biosynthesis/CDP-glycerol glycerophosphotransferase (TagB/SpsB family)
MGAKTYKYKFSFVIPVYNVENYLAETIESILAQTMDFEQNCELILVNDGSPDNSEEVCLRYKEQFPNNITYVKQKNAGPGAARNTGIALAQGKYISLLDSDDKLSSNTLDEVYKFIEKHYDEIDLVGIKWEFFEARQGVNHPLNYKFTSDRIIDLTKEYTNIQGSCAPAFFKTEVLKRHPFEPSVGRYSEDARLMGEILLDNPKFGVVTKPTYFYRKRLDQASSLDTTMKDKFWYLKTPTTAWLSLLEYAQKKEGTIPRFIQFMVMYDLQFRFKQPVQTVLNDTEQTQYKTLLYGLLQHVSDEVIVAQRNISIHYKMFILGKKHHESVTQNLVRRGHKYFYRDVEVYDTKKSEAAVHIEILEAEESALKIEGYYTGLLPNSTKLQFRASGKVYEVESIERTHRHLKFLDEVVSSRNGFKATIPISPDLSIEAFAEGESAQLPYVMHRHAHLSETARYAYRICGPWLISKHQRRLNVSRYHSWRRIGYEVKYIALLAKRLKLGIFSEQFNNWRQLKADGAKTKPSNLKWVLIPPKSLARNAFVITFRLTYFIAKPFYRRPIWLVSDRLTAADDSGEVLFHYLRKRADVKAKVYFVLSKKSGEYPNLKKTGKLVPYFSFRQRLLFLLADKVISSHADDYVINPFGGRVDDLVDLYNFDFVFLQHGIIKDDISNWLNRYNKNIKMFVTSTKPEYESIITGNYGYDENVVQLTGLPRHDNLVSKPKNKLIVAPTWRESLAMGIDIKTGFQAYNPNFKKSDYFKFYQDLIADPKLAETMKRRNFTGEFYLHPALQAHTKDFKGGERFNVMHMPHDYPKLKREGNLLVTDYSSVAFDFAYLKKPILYAHFDEDQFYKTHISREGYFSYEEHGMGPVTYDYDTTVKEIISYINSGCKMQREYIRRVNNFFAFGDHNNSKRVYEAILAINNPTTDG